MSKFFSRVLSRLSFYLQGFFLFFITTFIFISILSYSPFDPSYSRSTNSTTMNWAGKLGAYSSDIILQLIGRSSYLLVLIFGIWSIRFFIEGTIRNIYTRTFFLCLSIIFLSAFLALFNRETHFSSAGLGGYIGYVIMNLVVNNLGQKVYFMSTLALFLIFFIITISFTFSEFISFCRMVVSSIKKILSFSLSLLLAPFKIIFRRRAVGSFNEDIFENDDEIFAKKPEHKISKPKILKTNASKNESIAPKTNHALGKFSLPPIELLKSYADKKAVGQSQGDLKRKTEELMVVLGDFGVNGNIISVNSGPVVTLFELEPAAGTKSSRVIGLSDDISRSMKSESARIAVIPGRNALGIELPNKHREMVYLRELMESKEYHNPDLELPVILGKNISGKSIIVDLAKMPHLLIAGTTGSGKSVGINTMILSLLYRLSPEQCKLIMIDPKVLELSVYDGIPHLLTPVVTEPNKAVSALKWVVKEMENRYRKMSNVGVRNIKGYNDKIIEAKAKGEMLEKNIQTGYDPESGKPIFEKVDIEMETLPLIVVVVDEMADLMLVAGKDIETSIQRLSQMARAAGIHIIMATQRPSVDVITGVIKANFPTRISFQVTSRIDSRTIIGEQGAEQLLGSGDMLYLAAGGKITRVHGPYVSDREVEAIVAYLKDQGEPNYLDSITIEDDNFASSNISGGSEEDNLYNQAVDVVRRDQKVSTSYIQRRLRIGYNRAALIIERMEEEGVVSQANHVGKREILK